MFKRKRRFHSKGWVLGVTAERISRGRWVVEWEDGDPMGGSSNTVRILTDDELAELATEYKEY